LIHLAINPAGKSRKVIATFLAVARIADSARLKSAAWNGHLERRSPVPVRRDRGRLHLLSREPGSEIGCLPPACGAPSPEGQLHPVRLTATAT
jgi:hypothetical protein